MSAHPDAEQKQRPETAEQVAHREAHAARVDRLAQRDKDRTIMERLHRDPDVFQFVEETAIMLRDDGNTGGPGGGSAGAGVEMVGPLNLASQEAVDRVALCRRANQLRAEGISCEVVSAERIERREETGRVRRGCTLTTGFDTCGSRV
jgi:hypothetical protein